MTKHLRHIIYLAGFILSFHLALPAYANSSFLAQFGTDAWVSVIFILASLASLIGIAQITKLIARYGLRRSVSVVTIFTIALALTLSIISNPWLIGLGFILFYAGGLVLRFCLDIYLEDFSSDKQTGGIRGLFLALTNFAWLLSPLIAAWLIGSNHFSRLFIVAAIILFPLLYLINQNLHDVADPRYEKSSILQGLKALWQTPDSSIRSSLILNFILNLFYACMAIYMPLYLTKVIGFSWPEIGIIFTWMLLPFPLIQYPLGKLADKWCGETELITIGLLIMGLSTAAIPFMATASIIKWSALLFTTRIGAATLEGMSEAYFFKHVGANNVNTISFYRNVGPLSFLIAPIIATIVLPLGSYTGLFILLGIICLFGLYYSTKLVDTR